MLTATLLLAALAATVPDEAVVDVTPAVGEEAAAPTVVTGDDESAPVAEITDQPETSDQSPDHLPQARAISHRAHETQAVTTATVIRAAAVDSAPPVVAITSPTANPITGIAGTPLMISGTATDDVALASVKWQLTGPRTGSGGLPLTGTWSHTFTSLVAGTYTFTVTATDSVGKPSTPVSRPITITRAGTPPPTDPPPDDGNSGDIKKDVKKCGLGGGIAAFLLLCGSLAALIARRRIE